MVIEAPKSIFYIYILIEEVFPTEGRECCDHGLTWLAARGGGYSNVLTTMLGNLQLSEDHRSSWGGRVDRYVITTHIPDIERTMEEKMREQKMTRREREIEEAFFHEAWRMEVEEWGPGVWYSDGSLMTGQVGAGSVSMAEPLPTRYSLRQRQNR